MEFVGRKFKKLLTPKIQACRSQHGDFVVKLSATHWEYFWERKAAKEFIKNYMEEM